jgi:hypothetical protein
MYLPHQMHAVGDILPDADAGSTHWRAEGEEKSIRRIIDCGRYLQCEGYSRQHGEIRKVQLMRGQVIWHIANYVYHLL